MEGLKKTDYEMDQERVAWEGLASACASPLVRLGAFAIVGFAFFSAAITAVILCYHLFGEREIPGQGIAPPKEAFYIVLASSAAVVAGGYTFWLGRSLRAYAAFSRVLRRGGLDPKRPTRDGLKAYSDEQLLALRSRFERMAEGKRRALFSRLFGFDENDSFASGPLSALPGTFEMSTLRVEWESGLILTSAEPMPEVTFSREGRLHLMPRRLDETTKLLFVLSYTAESVRMLKRRYGYRTDRWHLTVPDGKLWNAVRDHEQARRVQSTLSRRMRS